MERSIGKSILGWFVTLVLPLILLLTSMRLLLTPAFVDLEYSMPGFPEDPYGMTFAERRTNARVALASLLDARGVSLLEAQTFEDGSPMYNDREIGHMVDVRVLTQIALKVWVGLLVLVGAIALFAGSRNWGKEFHRWLVRGAQLTVGLIVAILLFVALSFNALFTGFHRIFFEGDTWLFQFSDTLIRLFPMRFWQDVFIGLGVLTLLGAGLIWWGLGRIKVTQQG